MSKTAQDQTPRLSAILAPVVRQWLGSAASSPPARAAKTTRQSGSAVVLTAILLTTLCGVAAMAIDVGIWCTAMSGAQNAADAAALAGAFTFLKPANAQPAAAQAAAIAVAASNYVLGAAVTIAAANVTVDSVHQRVTVTVPRTGANAIPSYFAQFVGINSTSFTATATAEAGAPSGTTNLRPVFIPNTILSELSPLQACQATPPQIIIDPSTGGPSQWLQANPTLYGSLQTIRPTSPSGELAPSEFYSLDLGGGSTTYGCNISQPYGSCTPSTTIFACGTSYPTLTGNMKGPTVGGFTSLIGSPADTWKAPGAYLHNSGPLQGMITDTSRSLIVAPVWDNCNCANPPTCGIGPGGGTANLIGFSNWFVESASGNVDGDSGVIANFINGAYCPTGTSGSNATFGIPVRLVTPH